MLVYFAASECVYKLYIVTYKNITELGECVR